MSMEDLAQSELARRTAQYVQNMSHLKSEWVADTHRDFFKELSRRLDLEPRPRTASAFYDNDKSVGGGGMSGRAVDKRDCALDDERNLHVAFIGQAENLSLDQRAYLIAMDECGIIQLGTACENNRHRGLVVAPSEGFIR
jgi:hypothetical protein